MQKKILLLSVFMLSVFGIALGAAAETPVIGFIAQDTTWTQAKSPYVTLGNIIVKEGVTLTIEPGVTVQFDSGHSLTIEGTLIARGTDKQDIKFTPKGEQKPGAWDGIVFEDSSIDAKFDATGNYVSGSILQYCTVEFAGTGVEANYASPFIDHCVISNNGTGISISKGDIVVIQDSTIADNKGGGILVVNSESVTLTENTVTGNTAKDYGGGIYIEGGTATISNNTLTGNTASYTGDRWKLRRCHGGGMYVKVSTAIISNNILTGNAVKESEFIFSEDGGSFGGGIYIEGGTITISNNILTGNTVIGSKLVWGEAGVGEGGGIFVHGSGVTIINNNTLIGNTAQGGQEGKGASSGGGIYIYGGTTTISDNFLAGNTADSGGGIYSKGGSVLIRDNVITENHGYSGTAIFYSDSKEITGNIITNNGAGRSAVCIYGNPKFTGNTIIGNQTKFNLDYGLSKGSANLNAINNYWGLTNEAEIRLTICDFFIADSRAIADVAPFLVENPLPFGSLTVVVNPKVLPADGIPTVAITATLKDAKGNPIVDEPLTMIMSKSEGRLSEVKNNGDGTYTATYTASCAVFFSEIILVIASKSRLAKSVEILKLVDNGDGTITDLTNGLMWTKYTVARTQWAEAIRICENLRIGGYSDWRLPTKEEMLIIIDKKHGVIIDTNIFPDVDEYHYWTSESINENYAWTFYFGEGRFERYGKWYYDAKALAVRKNQ